MSLPALLTQHIAHRPQRIALLQHIAEQGSITRAAKSAGLSYKAAWDAIDELNNLAQQPLVQRSVGGKGGGGARLSALGERVLRLYLRVQAVQAQLLEAAQEPGDLELLGRLMLRTSARNQLHGTLQRIERQGHYDHLHIALPDEQQLCASITHASTQRLELQAGSAVVALIKAGWLHLLPSDAPRPAGHNRLCGRIESLLASDEGPSEVRISLGNGQTLCAFAAPAHLQVHGLGQGSQVAADFSPEQVLLGTPA